MQQPPYYQQPIYNYQPPQTPPKRNIWQKFRSLPMIMQIIVGLFVIIFVGSAGISAIQDTLVQSGATPGPAQVQATNVPTVIVTTHTPLLGSPISDFIGKYGQPNGHTDIGNGSYHFQRYADTSVATDGLIVQTDITDAGMSKTVMSILYAPETGKVSCDAFLPGDAVYQKQVPLTTSKGYDKIYFSTSLAALFPASAFTDNATNPIKAGLFDVQYLIKTDGTLDSCDVQIGTQQTQG